MGTSLKTFSLKHAGAGLSKSSVKRTVQAGNDRSILHAYKRGPAQLLTVLFLSLLAWTVPGHSDNRAPTVMEKAAEQCLQKLKKIMDFTGQNDSNGELATRITEEEINAYLSLNLNSKYQPCLKTMKLMFKQDLLDGLASIDFDCIQGKSSKSYPGYISLLFTGTHVITSRGKVVSENGEGWVELEQTGFDGNRLPNFLVEEAVEAVCEAQKVPFNPLQPSRLPYAIKRITVRPGYIIVYQ